MGALKPWHIFVVVVVFVILFGWKKLPDISRSVGRSARILKSEVDEMKAEQEGRSSAASGQTVTGSVADNLQQGMSNFRQGFHENDSQAGAQGTQGNGAHAANPQQGSNQNFNGQNNGQNFNGQNSGQSVNGQQNQQFNGQNFNGENFNGQNNAGGQNFNGQQNQQFGNQNGQNFTQNGQQQGGQQSNDRGEDPTDAQAGYPGGYPRNNQQQ